MRLIFARARFRKHGNFTALCPYQEMVLEKKVCTTFMRPGVRWYFRKLDKAVAYWSTD